MKTAREYKLSQVLECVQPHDGILTFVGGLPEPFPETLKFFTKGELIVFLVNDFDVGILLNGIAQHFLYRQDWNVPWSEVPVAFKEIGANSRATIIEEALRLCPEGRVPQDWQDNVEIRSALKMLECEYSDDEVEAAEPIDKLSLEYMRAHPSEFSDL